MTLSDNNYINTIVGLQNASFGSNLSVNKLDVDSQEKYEKVVQQILLEEISKQAFGGFFINENPEYGMLLNSLVGSIFTESIDATDIKEGGI